MRARASKRATNPTGSVRQVRGRAPEGTSVPRPEPRRRTPAGTAASPATPRSAATCRSNAHTARSAAARLWRAADHASIRATSRSGADPPRFEGVPDLTRASKKEWLLTNGLGGYSMSTASGLNTRRWHGLLVAAMRQPVGRAVVLSKMDETLDFASGPVPLDTNFYPGVVHPRGFEHIESFSLYPFPAVVFSGPGWRLEKTIYLVHGENLSSSPQDARRASATPRGPQGEDLRRRRSPPLQQCIPSRRAAPVEPSPRRCRAWSCLRFGSGGANAHDRRPRRPPPRCRVSPLEMLRLRVRPRSLSAKPASCRSRTNHQRPSGCAHGFGGSIGAAPHTDGTVYLVCPTPTSSRTGLDKNLEYPGTLPWPEYREDLWSYGFYETRLMVGQTMTIACTLHSPEKRAPGWPVEREIERRAQIMMQVPDEKPFARRLGLAAEQFLVRREREHVSIVAGYPWMEDSSRDTMIALPGLLLVTGRHRERRRS